MTDTTSESVTQMLKGDSKVFYGIFVASFAVLLVVALASQVLTWQWRSWLPGAEAEKSMIGGVKSAVYTFMSHLT
jgi:light-harvesting complex 1 beta chain